MDWSRRKFLSTVLVLSATGGGFSYAANKNDKEDLQDKAFYKNENKDSLDIVRDTSKEFVFQILPKALRKGSKIAITAPASGTSLGEVSRGAKFFRSMNCEVEVGDTIKERTFKYQYFSAPDEARAEEFMEFIERKDIDCILCARGGYGSARILPYLDFATIRKNPKIIIGFSDITALLNAIYCETGIVTFHGPVASSSYNDFTKKHVKEILFDNEDFQPIKIVAPNADIINGGKASGRLSGGNLSIVSTSVGTPYEIDTNEAILFLEETFTEPYKIDRMLTQLWNAGKLQTCKAVALGNFEGLDSRRSFYPGRSYTIREVLTNRFKDMNIPVILGLPFGHVKKNATLPIGINAELNADQKYLKILEKSVFK